MMKNIRCTNCGQELGDNIRFCTNCGTPVEEFPQIQTIDNGNDVFLSTTDSIPTHKIVNSMGVIYATWAKISSTRSGIFELVDAFTGNLGADSYITYTEEKCYESVIKRIKEMALNNQCNAVIGLRFISHFSENVLRITAYGTACIIE